MDAHHRVPGLVRLVLVTIGSVGLLGAGGCGFGGVTVPLALENPDALGFKMLKPAAVRRACGLTLWPQGERRFRVARRAMESLLAEHPEANIVRDVEVTWRGIDGILFHLGCVSARGDVGRVVSAVSLPMLGDHPGHGQAHGPP